jgi:hypothetical protein
VAFTILEQSFIGGAKAYYPTGIEPWYYFISWTTGTPLVYPESWFWINHAEAVMALTYEDMNSPTAGNYDITAYALLHGVADYMGIQLTGLGPNAQSDVREIQLHQSYPNPVDRNLSNSSFTLIEYQLNRPQHVHLELFDILGRKILTLDDGYRSADIHRVRVNTAKLATGKYFYRLKTGKDVQIKHFTIIK